MNYRALIGLMARAPGGGGGFDPDAEAYFTAAGISDTTIKNAWNQCVLDMKADSLWTIPIAIYPLPGSTSAINAVNAKNPGTFDITWQGSGTHDSNGYTGDGSTGYGDTGITPSSHLTLNDTHVALYCRSAGANEVKRDFTILQGSNAFGLNLRLNDVAGAFAYDTGTTVTAANTDARGFYVASRRSSTDFELYKNGSSINTNTGTGGGSLPTINLWLGARNSNGSLSTPTARNYSFGSVGASMTDTDVANYHAAVEAYEDTLSRGVV